MQVSNLRYFLALDREQHFARAAQLCNVTQPTLSAGIAALEEQLGRRLVDRDRRFIGFTPEGQAALPWARQVVAAIEGLEQAASSARGPLQGELRLGAIPASLPFTGVIAASLRRSYPLINIAIHSLTSREIDFRLAQFGLDAGLTYISHEPPANTISVPLYAEQMVFVERARESRTETRVSWDEALSQPLCLLHQGMQNRRILDANLAESGLALSAAATADSYVTLLSLVQSGAFATIMPDSYAPLLPGWARMIQFDRPMPPSRIGLVVPDRSPLGPLALAALDVAKEQRNPG